MTSPRGWKSMIVQWNLDKWTVFWRGKTWSDYRGGHFIVAVSCGYDTCCAVKACDGLCHLTKTMGRTETPSGFPGVPSLNRLH